MKNKYLHNCFVLLGLATFLFSCEKNDPFDELGKVVSDKVPFITTSGIQNLYAADDSILFNVYYWAIDDNIEKLALGKGERIDVAGNISLDDGGGPVSVDLTFVIEKEIAPEGTDIQHNPLDYETARNAYNKSMIYHISPQYQLLELEEAEQLASIDELAYAQEIKQNIVDTLQLNGIQISSWEELENITTGVTLKIESTLNFQMTVIDAQGEFNQSGITTVKVGAIE
jgi:hypothetical protein